MTILKRTNDLLLVTSTDAQLCITSTTPDSALQKSVLPEMKARVQCHSNEKNICILWYSAERFPTFREEK